MINNGMIIMSLGLQEKHPLKDVNAYMNCMQFGLNTKNAVQAQILQTFGLCIGQLYSNNPFKVPKVLALK